jgi:4-amino-4-deoxy-L-arabinose transferase-like glycosyltransferase
MKAVTTIDSDQQMEPGPNRGPIYRSLSAYRDDLIVISFATLIFIGCIFSPPSLMNDVDAVQAQISRNMIQSGDWTTARLDGIPYMEKAPLKYWLIAASFLAFGVHDWAARIPIALSAVLLCWVVARFGAWAFGNRAGGYAGLCLATCAGLFLFTRVLIPDCMLTLSIATSIFAMARLLDSGKSGESGGPRESRESPESLASLEPAESRQSIIWPMLFWAGMAVGVLLKGLIGVLFPVATTLVYVVITGRFFSRETWTRFRPVAGVILFLAIAAPWHVLAAIRNPPIFDATLHSEAGSYRGFFWFYFINEQVLRFLNRRYPRDYDTVPRLYFWVLHLVWLFPWSLYLPAVLRMNYRQATRSGRMRVLALCWVLVVLVFFSLSTTQEYYSLPCYPALALLIGQALASGDKTIRLSTRMAGTVAALALAAIVWILYLVRHMAAPGDISTALSQHPEVYTLSLGHMTELTLKAFAYLRLPLVLAAVAFAVGAAGAWIGSSRRAILSLALMMAVLFFASQQALTVFDPYLSSRALAEALERSPEGQLIVDDPYWEFSSVFFYSNKSGLLLNGRRNNLEYGSYSPGAPPVFIGDEDFITLWNGSGRCYVMADEPEVPHLGQMVGSPALHLVAASGGKYLFSNRD